MAIWISDPSLLSYEIGQGEYQLMPPMHPPTSEDYQDYSRAWQIEMERNIGAHPWLQFVLRDDAGNEIDITHCVADGGCNGFRMEVPFRSLDQQGYQVTDWRIQLRPTHIDELFAILGYAGVPWRGRRVWVYLRLARAGDRCPMYVWEIDDIQRGDPPLLVLLDMRRDMLRGPLYADGMDVPGATSWLDTIVVTDADGGTAPAFRDQYVTIMDRCEIGHVEIVFTSASEYTITGPGFNGTGTTTTTYYTDDEQHPNSQFRIEAGAWAAGGWAEGDEVEWDFTFSFQRYRDASGYIRIPAAMYWLARLGGYPPEDFDASPVFPGLGQSGLPGWQLCGYPCITTAEGWTDLVGPTVVPSSSWDYAEWYALQSHFVRIAFSQSCTVLEALAEVGKGVAYIMPGKSGKLELHVPADYGGDPVVLGRATGLMRCFVHIEKPGGFLRAIHEYDHIGGKWKRLLLYPEDRSQYYEGYRPPEGTQESRFLGYPRVLESVLANILGEWHRIHRDGAPICTARCGLMGMHYACAHRLEVTSTEADITANIVVVDGIEYDFTTWTATPEGVNWTALGIEPLIFQGDDSLDEEHVWDGEKTFA